MTGYWTLKEASEQVSGGDIVHIDLFYKHVFEPDDDKTKINNK